MRISDWSSDVCSSDLRRPQDRRSDRPARRRCRHAPRATPRLSAVACQRPRWLLAGWRADGGRCLDRQVAGTHTRPVIVLLGLPAQRLPDPGPAGRLRLGAVAAVCVLRTPRSEEHTSELQSLMRISYAVFCLKKKKKCTRNDRQTNQTDHIDNDSTNKNTTNN